MSTPVSDNDSMKLSYAELSSRGHYLSCDKQKWHATQTAFPLSEAEYAQGHWEEDAFVFRQTRYYFAEAIPVRWYGSGSPGSRAKLRAAMLKASQRLDMVQLDCIESTLAQADALLPSGNGTVEKPMDVSFCLNEALEIYAHVYVDEEGNDTDFKDVGYHFNGDPVGAYVMEVTLPVDPGELEDFEEEMNSECEDEEEREAYMEEYGYLIECGGRYCGSLSAFEGEDSSPAAEWSRITCRGDYFWHEEYSGHCYEEYVPVRYLRPGVPKAE